MRGVLTLLLLMVLPLLISMLPLAAGALPGEEPVVPAHNFHNLHSKK